MKIKSNVLFLNAHFDSINSRHVSASKNTKMYMRRQIKILNYFINC